MNKYSITNNTKESDIMQKETNKDVPLRVMKTDLISLKLTESEWELFEGRYDEVKAFCQGANLILDVLDVDKFREFLNDEIDKCFPTDENGCSEMISAPNGVFYEGSESQKRDNFTSILSKLNKGGK